MITLKHFCPHYGPSGEPYRVRARFADRTHVEHFHTQAQALDARDAAFDAGAHAVHVSGPLAVKGMGAPLKPSQIEKVFFFLPLPAWARQPVAT